MIEHVVDGAKATNQIGLTRADYRGVQSTLCPGCGHMSIANQIVNACYELNLVPEQVVKFSGIGCSSKSPTYFLGRSFGFNGLHGRMPSLATGASFADTSVEILAISGDGDTASIGMGQFKHCMRRNTPMVYIVENNGVYGLTKGQYSATTEQGIQLRKYGKTKFMPVDICLEALASNATFVARSFAGDPKQVKELIKAAIKHSGVAVLDIISPCVTFHNLETSLHSYVGGKGHEVPLHDIAYVPLLDEITVDDFETGTIKEVALHDGGHIVLKKLGEDYDPFSRAQAFHILEEAHRKNWLVTGLIYVDPDEKNLHDLFNLVDTPLNRLKEEHLRPPSDMIDVANQLMQ
ncbi:MAG: 2-oxoacid:ferredoxin oxidoreductase subunit beta [Anaerolineae bacterium]|nr:2-oxoacid:ferredoxin oxidoreductase subunit beta [Anaerolineae bacterium]